MKFVSLEFNIGMFRHVIIGEEHTIDTVKHILAQAAPNNYPQEDRKPFRWNIHSMKTTDCGRVDL